MMPIIKLLTPTVLKTIAKYVFEENELDYKVKNLEDVVDKMRERIIKLEVENERANR